VSHHGAKDEDLVPCQSAGSLFNPSLGAQRIIPVIGDLSETTKTNHKVHDQKQHNQVASKDGGNLHVRKAPFQAFLEFEAG